MPGRLIAARHRPLRVFGIPISSQAGSACRSGFQPLAPTPPLIAQDNPHPLRSGSHITLLDVKRLQGSRNTSIAHRYTTPKPLHITPIRVPRLRLRPWFARGHIRIQIPWPWHPETPSTCARRARRTPAMAAASSWKYAKLDEADLEDARGPSDDRYARPQDAPRSPAS